MYRILITRARVRRRVIGVAVGSVDVRRADWRLACFVKICRWLKTVNMIEIAV